MASLAGRPKKELLGQWKRQGTPESSSGARSYQDGHAISKVCPGRSRPSVPFLSGFFLSADSQSNGRYNELNKRAAALKKTKSVTWGLGDT